MDEQLNRESGQGQEGQEGRYDDGGYGEAGNSMVSAAMRIREQAGQKAEHEKEKVADLGRKAGEKIDEQRVRAASTFDSTVSAQHDRGDRFATTASSAAHATADKIQAAADYLREHDARAMTEGIEGLVRRHPGQALAAAVVVGFLAGRALRNGD